MKKKVKKLQLNRETVRNLSNEDVKKVVGGTTSECTYPKTCCFTCQELCCS